MTFSSVEGVWHELAVNGYAYIQAGIDATDFADWSSQFGPLLPQHGGEYVWRVEAISEHLSDHSSKSAAELFPHTENYESPDVPPRYVALYCVSPALCGGGVVSLSDLAAWWDSADESAREVARSPIWAFASNATIASMGAAESAVHALATPVEDHYVFRFKRGAMRCLKPEVEGAIGLLAQVEEVLMEQTVDFLQRSGSILIWDNHRFSHSRSGFRDHHRLLLRTWMR